jgi:hypothetical protein
MTVSDDPLACLQADRTHPPAVPAQTQPPTAIGMKAGFAQCCDRSSAQSVKLPRHFQFPPNHPPQRKTRIRAIL